MTGNSPRSGAYTSRVECTEVRCWLFCRKRNEPPAHVQESACITENDDHDVLLLSDVVSWGRICCDLGDHEVGDQNLFRTEDTEAAAHGSQSASTHKRFQASTTMELRDTCFRILHPTGD